MVHWHFALMREVHILGSAPSRRLYFWSLFCSGRINLKPPRESNYLCKQISEVSCGTGHLGKIYLSIIRMLYFYILCPFYSALLFSLQIISCIQDTTPTHLVNSLLEAMALTSGAWWNISRYSSHSAYSCRCFTKDQTSLSGRRMSPWEIFFHLEAPFQESKLHSLVHFSFSSL